MGGAAGPLLVAKNDGYEPLVEEDFRADLMVNQMKDGIARLINGQI
jgi:hypothetical protein